MKSLQNIRIVRCDEAAWRLFGVSLAGYDVIVSFVLVLAAAFGFWHTLGRPREE
jgi:disulfide bond formation protein DsbB